MLRRAAIRRTCEGACNVVCRRAQYSWFVSFALECVLESRVRPVFTLLTSLCLKFLCFMQVVRQARALQRQFATELGAAGRLLQSGPLPGACYRAGRLLPGACWSRALQRRRRAWALPGACERAARAGYRTDAGRRVPRTFEWNAAEWRTHGIAPKGPGDTSPC